MLIYKSTEVINFAQGELLLVGAYLTFGLMADFGLAWPLGVLITLVLAAVLGSSSSAWCCAPSSVSRSSRSSW
ncbi:hypothetical protein [Candidatus Amarobacter glycogenicus]|uniref:ABC transporter permease subunit n=1 Tax=Candidatus Amarobacter glycogenicus TaxID=3140699 RepID=UPI0031CC7149